MNQKILPRERNLKNPEISIVIPVYANSENLIGLHRRLCDVLNDQFLSYEMIFINDACPKDSKTVLDDLGNVDPRVITISLEKNVGQHRAVMIGLSRTRGERVVIMDADLQDPPEAIPGLFRKQKEGYGAVFAGRRGRYESRSRMITSKVFKYFLHRLTGLPKDAGMFVIITRELTEELLKFYAPHPYVVAMIGLAGFPVTSIPVERGKRTSGLSTYSFWMRFTTALNCLVWVFYWKYLSHHSTSHFRPDFYATEKFAD